MKTLFGLTVILPFLLMNCTTDNESSFTLTWADSSVVFPYTAEQVQKMVKTDLVSSTIFYDDSLLMVGYRNGMLDLGPHYVTSSNAAYELSTNDSVRAYNLVDSMYGKPNAYVHYGIQQLGTTEKFFQFKASRPDIADLPILWCRVHKSSYIDRSMFVNNKYLSADGPLGQLAVVPVTMDKFVEADRYLYMKCPHLDGTIIVDSSGANGDTLNYFLYQVINYDESNGYFGGTIYYIIFRLSFTANAKNGLIAYSRKEIRRYEYSW